ncbi:MAG: endonuclease/exonuclease/phosphatase family protein [Candidatus Heimdallarchaeota archaeon]|nr:endonuclease/exonuclease/phosphatase family protein [Candidatus Heimdallarchaeota archaeon]
MESREWQRSLIFASYLFFFISFIRAIISISIGSLLSFMSEVQVALLLLLPILLSYLLYKAQRIASYSLSSLGIFWLITVILSYFDANFILRFVFLLLGFSVSVYALIAETRREYFASVNLTDAVLQFILIDYAIRLLNSGHEPLFSMSNHLYRILFPVLLIFIIFYILITYRESGFIVSTSRGRQSVWSIGMIPLLFLYTFMMNNPGILVLVENDPILALISACIQMILVFFVVRFIQGKYIPSLMGIILLIATIIYPYHGTLAIFWFFAPLGFIYLLVYNLSLNGSFKSPHFHYLGYLVFVSLALVMLMFEYYFLFPILIGLQLIIIVITRNNLITLHIPTIKKKLYIILLLLLLIPIFYYTTPSDPVIDDFSVMTYNIHYGTDAFGHDNMQRIVDFIEVHDPTVIGFQEVTIASPLNAYGNVYAFLIDGLGELGYLYHAISEGGQYAIRNAIFSKYPILSEKTIDLEPRLSYDRTAILTTLDIQSNQINFASVHLTHIGSSNGTEERLEQVKDLLASIPDQNTILVGDFNSRPFSPEQLLLRSIYNDAWLFYTTSMGTSTSDLGFTSPAEDPNKRIDYIFYNDLVLDRCQVIDTTVSDHLPVQCWFDF